MSKKRIVYSLMLVLVLNLSGSALAATKISDVPTDHWAYYAVNNAINKGYLTVFEDGKFKGSDSVDRYTLATVINLLLEQMEVAQVRGTTGDLSLIRELSLDFEKDLANWYANEKILREEVQQTQNNALIAEERLSRVVSAQVDLEENLEGLETQIKSLQASIIDIQLGVSDVKGDFAGRVDENQEHLAELLQAVLQIDKELSTQSDALLAQERAIHSLENWAGEKGAVFATLQLTNESLTEETKNLKQRNQELESDIRTLAITLRQQNSELSAELAETKEELELAQANLITLQADLKQQVGADVNAQINAALIREQRLEQQLKDMEIELAEYRTNANKEVKSAKSLATIAIALAAIGAVIGFVAK